VKKNDITTKKHIKLQDKMAENEYVLQIAQQILARHKIAFEVLGQ